MKILKVESLHADGGFRNYDFLKVTADNGLVGWSEYNESFGGKGVSAIIDRLAPVVIGRDPRAFEAQVALMYAMRRPGQGGAVHQAIGAIENAMLDLKARALGIPVYELFGGPVRERVRLYWSHCATYRVSWPEAMHLPPVRTLDDLVALGREVRDRGFTALKTNVFVFRDGQARQFVPGFARGEGFPELNADRDVLRGTRDTLAALREGAGDGIDMMVDLNFNFKTEGFLRMARAIEAFDLLWVEIDTMSPEALREIRSRVGMPVASGECLFGRRDYRPYFERQAMDVCIVDVPWNGLAESLKVAAMADAYEVNVAPHNFYGHLSTFMSAHLAACVPNLRIMEIDPDHVPWHDDLVTVKPEVKDGYLTVPEGPGWGTEIDEAAVRAHPPRAAGKVTG